MSDCVVLCCVVLDDWMIVLCVRVQPARLLLHLKYLYLYLTTLHYTTLRGKGISSRMVALVRRAPGGYTMSCRRKKRRDIIA